MTSRSRHPVGGPRRGWGLVAAAVLVLTVAIIRTNAPGTTSGSLTPVTVEPRTHVALVPVSTTVLAQFADASERLDTANVAITQPLARSNGAPVAQVAQEVAPYLTA